MVTEQQRLQLLAILSCTLVDMDKIVAEAKKHGLDITPEQIRASINFLKQQKGK